MSALRVRAEQYLAMRRALGFRLETQGPRLMSFVRFCGQRGAEHVTVDLAIAWATQTSRGSCDEVYQARRLDTDRGHDYPCAARQLRDCSHRICATNCSVPALFGAE